MPVIRRPRRTLEGDPPAVEHQGTEGFADGKPSHTAFVVTPASGGLPVHSSYEPPSPVAERDMLQQEQDALISEIRRRVTRQLSKGDESDEVIRAAVIEEIRNVNRERTSEGKLAIDEQLAQRIVSAIVGYGQLDVYLKDPSITEIMINGSRGVAIERDGRTQITDLVLDEQEILNTVERMLRDSGRTGLSDAIPLLDARLEDGSRVNAVHSTISRWGTTVTIRKFNPKPYSIEDLMMKFRALTPTALSFLTECVRGRINILVAGGTGSGKTTLLNALADCIPDDERLIVVEDISELRPKLINMVQMERRPPNAEGKGEVTLRQLVINALRMRPDRIIVGECRGAEAFEMLQAMNTGHQGSLTTVHANSPRDALTRVEQMCLMSDEGKSLPLRALKEQIASAVDLIIFQSRRHDGARRITEIVEVASTLQGESYTLKPLFELADAGDPSRERLVATGYQVDESFSAKAALHGQRIHLLPKEKN
jgi:pilus assembly protein CpaF